jgi:hypothetical protein
MDIIELFWDSELGKHSLVFVTNFLSNLFSDLEREGTL